MLKRSPIASALVCAGLGLGGSALTVHAQDLTAREQYDLALELHGKGQSAQALERLRQIDPLDLSDDVRRSYYELLVALDPNAQTTTDAPAAAPAPEAEKETPPEPASVSDMLADAVSLPMDQAAEVYQLVLTTAEATAAEKAVARARLSQIQRTQSSNGSAAKALIDAANTDIYNGDYAQAKAKLIQAQKQSKDLGFFDQERIKTRLALVEERLEVQALETQLVAEAEPEAIDVASDVASEEVATEEAPAEQIVAEQAPAEPVVEETVVAQEVVAEPVAEPEPAGLSPAQIARVNDLLANGDSALAVGKVDIAINWYSEASLIDPENETVNQKLAEAREALAASTQQAPVQTGDVAADSSMLEDYLDRRATIKDAYLLRYNERIAAAKRSADRGDFAPARDFANGAIEQLDEGRTYFSQAEFVALREGALTLIQSVDTQEQAAVIAEQRKAASERQTQIEQQREQLAKQRHEQVYELLTRALDLRKQGEYEAALAKAQEALFVDKTDPTAQLMVDAIQADLLLVRSAEMTNKRRIQVGYQQLDNLEAVVPYRDVITYPANWPEISKRRLEDLDESGGESAASRKTQQLLDETILPTVSFEGTRLSTVINFLSANTGANFFPNWSALELAGVDEDTPITLNMRNVSAAKVLDLTLRQASSDFEPVSYTIDDDVILIATETALATEVDVRIYDIRDLLLPIYDNFNRAPSFDLQNIGRQTGGSSGGGSQNIFSGNTQDNQNEQEEVREELIQSITTLIQDTVGDPLDWAINGGDVSSLYELRGRLVVRTTANNHADIRKLLSDFREFRSIAISIESRILLVDENFLEEVGVDFDFQIADPGGNWGPISVGQNSVGIAERGTNTTPATPARFSASDNVVGPQTTFTPGLGITDSQGNIPGSRSLDFNVSYLDDIQASLYITATQANQRSLSLTAPRVTFLNGTSATVVISEQIAFISDLDVVPNASAFDPTIGVVNSGVVLAVEGAVSADRRYVTMNVWPSLSSVKSPIRQISFTGTTTQDTGTDGSQLIVVDGVIEAPETTLTQVRTMVSVPDEGTLLLGGQRMVGEIEVEAGVPVLSKVPFLRRLFTNTSTSKDERTLLILVKPTILLQDEQEDKAFPGFSKDPLNYDLQR